MSLVEGLGDEVTLAACLLALVLVLAAVWMSTWVRPALSAPNGMWLVPVRNERGDRRVIGVREAPRGTQPTPGGHNHSATAAVATAQGGSDAMGAGGARARGRQTVVRHMLIHALDDTTDSEESSAHSAQPPVAQTETEPDVAPESNATEATENATETTIRIKFLDETQKIVRTWLSSTVGQFKREHFLGDLDGGKSIRLIYQGQLLRDDSRSLASYGVRPDCTLHCHVSAQPYARHQGTPGAPAHGPAAGHARDDGTSRTGASDTPLGMEIGRYMHLLFLVKFSVLWVIFFAYPQYFDFSAFFSLILCSGVYVAFVYSSVVRRRRGSGVGRTVNMGVAD